MRMPSAEYFSGYMGSSAHSQESPISELKDMATMTRLCSSKMPSQCGVAPSFLEAMQDGDRIISTNTFSKSWLMTGWRLGWLVVPPSLMADVGKLIEYNTSCTPIFVQRAGIAAIIEGEPVIEHTRERFRHARDFLVAGLRRNRRPK